MIGKQISLLVTPFSLENLWVGAWPLIKTRPSFSFTAYLCIGYESIPDKGVSYDVWFNTILLIAAHVQDKMTQEMLGLS